jgi:hypothetical protein
MGRKKVMGTIETIEEKLQNIRGDKRKFDQELRF